MSDSNYEEKRQAIHQHERQIAVQVALKVVNRPLLALWMILIPIFFIYYFFQLKGYKKGLEDFIKNFMISRDKALDEVVFALERGTKPDLDELVSQQVGNMKPKAQAAYRQWMASLVEHYQLLLEGRGRNYADLVKWSYREKSSYLLLCNHLNRVEHDFNSFLISGIDGDPKELKGIVKIMEAEVEQQRRQAADTIYG